MADKIKKTFCLMILGILVLSLVGTISAEEILTTPEGIPFSFTSWFQHTFGIQDFSIVGDYRQCDRYPKKTLTFYPDQEQKKSVLMDIDAADYCSSGHGLLNFYVNNWNPLWEINDEHKRYCSYIYDKCYVEIYCCPHDECSRDRDCEGWYGDGSECKTKSANDPNIEYEKSSFKYCTEPSEKEVTCWYASGSTCKSRTYIGDEECPATYMNLKLYNTKSICEGSIPTNGDDNGDCVSQGGICRSMQIDCYENNEVMISTAFNRMGCGLLNVCCKGEEINGNGDDCTSHDSKKCYNNDVYWSDSCGVRETKYNECGSAGCSNGVCKTSDDGEDDGNGDNGDVNGNGEVPSVSLNQTLFKLGGFNVTILTILLIIGGAFIIKIMFSKRK